MGFFLWGAGGGGGGGMFVGDGGGRPRRPPALLELFVRGAGRGDDLRHGRKRIPLTISFGDAIQVLYIESRRRHVRDAARDLATASPVGRMPLVDLVRAGARLERGGVAVTEAQEDVSLSGHNLESEGAAILAPDGRLGGRVTRSSNPSWRRRSKGRARRPGTVLHGESPRR